MKECLSEDIMCCSGKDSQLEENVLSLSRSCIEEAKIYLKRKRYAEYTIFFLALISVVLPQDVYKFSSKSMVFIFSLVALVMYLWALVMDLRGRRYHFYSEQLKRIFMVCNSVGLCMPSYDVSDIKSRLSKSVIDNSEYYRDNRYFSSKSGKGYLRLKENIRESSFWSKNLYYDSAMQLLFASILKLLTLVVLFLLSGYFYNSYNPVMSRLFIIVLTSGLLIRDLFQSLDWWFAYKNVDSIDLKLENIKDDKILSLILSDYNVITALYAPIPTTVYEKNRDRLNKLWDERNTEKQ